MSKDRKELLEKVRTYYRTTNAGRKVRWDEPDRDDDPEVIRHNAAAANYLKKKKRQSQSRDKLKSQNKVPTKDGKPMWEELQRESYSNFTSSFRKAYYSNRTMTFRKWLETIEDLLDTLS
jgi:hypothetical protein